MLTRRLFLLTLVSLVAVAALIGVAASANKANRAAKARAELAANSKSAIDPALLNDKQPNLPLAPVITATLTDNITAATKVAPGGTINYTAVITNNGAASPADDATNLNYSDQLDANTTLVAGSVHASPIAFNDTYNWVGNTFLDTSARALPTVIANDVAVNAPAGTDTFTVTAIAGGATALGGTVTLASPSGAFTYTPPLGRPNLADGATVNDTFTYTITNSADPSLTATGTVTIALTGRVWYLQAGAAGDGRSGTPSGSPAAMSTAADKSTDIFYIFSNAGSLNGLFTVDAGQQLLGQGVNLVVNAITLFTATAPTPSTTNTAGSCVSLAGAPGNNTLSGFNIGNCTGGTAITGANVGTLNVSTLSINTNGGGLDLTGVGSPTVSVVLGGTTSAGGANSVNLVGLNGTITLAGGALSGASGTAFNVSGGAAAITYGGTISKTSAGLIASIGTHATGNIALNGNLTCNAGCTGINVSSNTSGIIDFGGSTKTINTGASAAVTLSSNTGATINFPSGGLNVTTTSGTAFSATGGGIFSVGGNSGNILNSTTGTALNVANTTIGASGLTFVSISSNGSTNGIVLNTTGSSGGLAVTGNGGTCTNTNTSGCSGGTIQNTTGDAISAINTQNLSLTRVLIQNSRGDGINASELRGTCLLDNSTMIDYDFNRTATKDGYRIVNTGTNALTLLTITGSSFDGTTSDAINPGSGDGVFMEAQGSGNMTLSVEGNSLFTEMFDDAVQVNGITGATSNINVTVKNSTFNNASAVVGNGGIGLFPFGAVNYTAVIDSNTFDTLMRPVTNLGAISGTNGLTATANITIKNNTLTNIIGSRGISFSADGSGLTTMLIDNNNIDRLGSTSKYAIQVNMITASANVKITNNDIGQNPSPSPAGTLWTSGNGSAEAILLLTQNSSTMNSLVTGNVVTANATLEVIRARAIQSSSQNVTMTGNTVTDSFSTHVGELALATGSGAVVGGNICFNVSGNTVPAAGVGVILITENAAPGNVTVTQASAAAVSAANNSATVTVSGTPTFGQPACTQPPIPNPVDDSVRNRLDEGLGSYMSTNMTTQAKIESAEPSVTARLVVQVSSKDDMASVLAKTTPKATAAEVARIYRSEVPLSHHAVRRSFNALSQDPNAPTSGETVTLNTIATLPAAGKSITVKYSATVNSPPLARQVSTQGSVSGSNFATINTDDPEPGGATDPTVTLVDTLMTWNGATNTDWNTITNWTQPAGGTQYAPGVSNPAVNDVVIPNVGAQPNISATDIGVYSLNISNGRTLTITNPRILTIGGSPGGDLTLNGVISGGELRLGTGTHVINNAGGTGSLSSTNVATVLSGSTVTLNNNLQAGALAVNAGGSMDISGGGGRTLSLNGSGAALAVAGTLTTTGSTVVFNGTAAQQTAGIAYNNLTINNTIGTNVTGVTLQGNATVNGVLALTSSDLDTGAFTLTQPNTTASTGVSDVVGTVTRSGGPFALATPLTFGNPNNIITFTGAGTRPTTVTVVMAKAAPATYAGAVQRNYNISQTGGSGFTTTVRLHYLDSELGTNTPEANLGLRRLRTSDSHWVAAPPPPGSPARDGSANWVEATGVLAADLPSQWTFSTLEPTAAGGVVTGRIVDSNGMPVEGAVVRLAGTQNRKFITDANGFYRFDNVETNGFYIATPSRANYTFSPSSRSFSQIGETTDAAFGATLTSGGFVNPLDTPEYFVRQHYLDFLGREPDEAGFNFWSEQILDCGADNQCSERRRENVSAAYFLSIEFQETGGLVDGLYRASYGVRPQFVEFMPDTRAVALGVVVGRAGWDAKLEANKQAFIDAFVNRPTFVGVYGNLDNSTYVDALISHTGVSFTSGERDALVSGLANGTLTRSAALRSIAENQRFVNVKFNEAFVMMEYFGYLRRDPDASGYAFWLNKLSEFNGNFERAEMVKAFIVSGEFRDRFPR